MPVLDHTIVASHDHRHAAAFVADLLGLPRPVTLGHFEVVRVSETTTLDFLQVEGSITSQHYAFLVTEAEFDEIFGMPYWADPGHGQPGEINTWDGGRGVYFDDRPDTASRSSPGPTAPTVATLSSSPVSKPSSEKEKLWTRVGETARVPFGGAS